jgi:hypothetical protein
VKPSIHINHPRYQQVVKIMSKKLKLRKAYQVVLDVGMRTIQIGWKGRLFGKRRANRVCKFLSRRGHPARVRYFGEIFMPESPRLFD